MKKSYHSIVVPMVDAMTALRSCALWSDADSVSYVAVVTVVSFARRFLVRRGQTPLSPTQEIMVAADAVEMADRRFNQLALRTTPSARRRCCGSHRVRRRAG